MVAFLDLARELRDLIYAYYVSTPDGEGYVYNPQTGKLKVAANGEPIDLSLMYTCKQVAHEMHGVALGTNLITFLPWAGHYPTPARFHFLRETMDGIEQGLLGLSATVIRRTPQLQPLLAQKYPDFLLKLQEATRSYTRLHGDESWKKEMGGLNKFRRNGWGDIPSVHRDAIQFTLRELASDPTWESSIWSNWRWSFRRQTCEDRLEEKVERADIPRPDSIVQVCLSTPCWSLPTVDDVDKMAATLKRKTLEHRTEFWEAETVTGEYHFSAAAVAISFLESLTKETRLQLRRLLLRETQPAVAFPECHAKGLIPYCQENPELRIERRLDMWTNLLRGRATEYFPCLPAIEISHVIGLWLVESMALIPAGMPPHCFSIVLDGGLFPEKCSALFEIMQRDAAWQLAWESYITRGLVPIDPTYRPGDDRDARYEPYNTDSTEYTEYTSNDSEYSDADTTSRFSAANLKKYAEWDSFVNLADIRSYHFTRLRPMWVFDLFPHAIRDIVNKSSIVRCNFNTGHLWDPQQIVQMAEQNHWRFYFKWEEAWKECRPGDFNEVLAQPPPGWDDLLKEDRARCESRMDHRMKILRENRALRQKRRGDKPANCWFWRYFRKGGSIRRKAGADERGQQADSSLPLGPSDTSSDEE